MTNPIQPMMYDPLALSPILDHIGTTLRRANLNLFRMEDRLVYVFRWEVPSSDAEEGLHRDANSLVTEPVDDLRLLEYITQHTPFTKIDRRTGAATPMAPPPRLAKHFLASKDRWRFQVLNGVIQAPTMRADGSLLTAPGYDRLSGLYLDTGGVEYPIIPDKPTRDDALEALELLKTPFQEFPFVITDDFESPSLSAALSAVLTGLIRRTLPTAPIHGFDAAEAGSGKGLACSIVTLIVTGNRATAITVGDSEIEFRKLLFSALLANDQVIVFDNLTRPLEGPSLNSCLTEKTITDRVLGVSQTATVPTNALLLANGNNLAVKGDTHRRIIAARIDAGERPEERTFKRPNVLRYVEENRPALVAAGLTVLRAYEVAGRPVVEKLPEFGSFEDWSARVRGALVWLGESDPCLTRERFKLYDTERAGLGALLRALHALRGEKWFRVNELIQMDFDAPLHTALEEVGLSTNAQSIGTYLARNEGKAVDGLRLDAGHDKRAKVRIYRVADTGATS
jgi:hypothetical protein